MKAIKISTIIIICFIFLTNISQSADKIFCKKYSGTYQNYKLSVSFTKNGKMLVEVEENEGGGYFSAPGSYSIKDSKINFFYRGLNRTLLLSKESITACPYAFSINDDYKTIITLVEDKTFSSNCK